MRIGKSKLCTYITVSLVILIMSRCIDNSYADENEPRLVTVAVADLSPFMIIDKNAKISGYSVEYMEYIAEKLGWKVKYKIVPLKKLVATIINNEVDLGVGFVKTETRLMKMDFNEIPIFISWGTVIAKRKKKESASNYIKNNTFGCLKSILITEEFKRYTSSLDINVDTKEYANVNELLDAYNNGDITAIVIGNNVANEIIEIDGEFKKIIIFSPFTATFVTAKNFNNELLKSIDNYMFDHAQENSEELGRLSVKYLHNTKDKRKLINFISILIIVGIIIFIGVFIYVIYLLEKYKRIVQELREKEELLSFRDLEISLSLEAGGIGIVKYDVENKRYYRDYKFYEHLGYTVEEAKSFNNDIFNILYEDDIPLVTEYQRKLLIQPIAEKCRIKIRIYKKDRSLATVLLLGKVIELSEENLPKTIYGVIVDVTEKDMMESENQKLMDLLKLVLDEYRMSTWEWNAQDNKITYHFLSPNNHMYKIVQNMVEGLSGDLVVTPGWNNRYIHPDDIQQVVEFRKNYQGLTKDDKNRVLSVQHRLVVNKTVYTMYLQVKVIEFKDDGCASRALGVVHDITDRVNKEENKAQSNKLEAIGALAGGVAHDFNNQLNGILGFVDLLIKNDELKDNVIAQKYLTIINDCGVRCEGLTSKLLAFARKGKEKQELFDIHLAVNNMIDMLEHAIDRSIMISKKLNAKSINVEGDKNQIENALLNIMLNACDAMPMGGNIAIETNDINSYYCRKTPLFEKYRNKETLIISIKDAGTGMDKSVLSKIFEPFYTTKEVGKGTGMGLAVVFGVIKNHGGEVFVESSVGAGTTFYICLPIKNEVLKKQEKSEKEIDDVDYNRKLLGKILVVDDEMSVRVLLKNYLQSFGCEAVMAENGEKAVEIYKEMKDEISLVISDISMPKMNGPETLIKLKEVNDKVKVILITGYAENDDKVMFMLDNGASELLKKPLNRKKLYMAIRKVIGE